MADTLQEALVRAAENGESEGLRFLDRHENETRVSWPEVHARAQRTAGGLRERGVRAGDCVAPVLPTGPEFFDAFSGTLLLGAVPVPELDGAPPLAGWQRVDLALVQFSSGTTGEP